MKVGYIWLHIGTIHGLVFYNQEKIFTDYYIEPKKSLPVALRCWALDYNITHQSLSVLLKILSANGVEGLPADSRTLLRTPAKKAVVTDMVYKDCKGQYWYNGIKSNLQKYADSEVSTISLIFNVDGIKPFDSSNLEFWPILFRISEMAEVRPMVAAVYYGIGKPPLNPFLNPLVDELLELLENGITINGKHIDIGVKFFVCDTPARSFLKGLYS